MKEYKIENKIINIPTNVKEITIGFYEDNIVKLQVDNDLKGLSDIDKNLYILSNITKLSKEEILELPFKVVELMINDVFEIISEINNITEISESIILNDKTYTLIDLEEVSLAQHIKIEETRKDGDFTKHILSLFNNDSYKYINNKMCDLMRKNSIVDVLPLINYFNEKKKCLIKNMGIYMRYRKLLNKLQKN